MKYTQEQQLAIETIDSNLQIIACAGSGKTQVISQRIVNILKKQDVEAKNIIAFTYTEKAAAELKTRILKLCREQLGNINGLAEMYIGTIHSWCLQSIQDHIFKYQKYAILDEIKLKLFIDKYFNEVGMATAGLDRYKETSRFISILSVLREAEIIEGVELPIEWKDALKQYKDTLNRHSYFDFTTIMTEAIENLKSNEVFKSKVLGKLKYLIVDEYQDVNPIQEELIKQLSKEGANICVVGDDDQTIYQWRGGDVTYIQNFQNRYKDVKYIKLEGNFRSTTGIVDVALKCITNNVQRLPKVMNAIGHQTFSEGDILYNQFEDVNSENQFIIETIKSIRGKEFNDIRATNPRGLDYSDCAILLRTWKKAKSIIEKLAEENIPFVVGGVNELFERPEIKASRAIFQFLNNDIEEDTLKIYWLSVSQNIENKDIDNAIEWLNKKIPVPTMYFATFNLQEILWKFIELAKLTEEVFEDNTHSGIVGNEINEVIFYNLGMFSQIINDFESIHFKDKPTFKLSRFLNFLDFSADGYYPEGWLNNSFKTPNAVQIMTVFQSKGLEFPVVFIPGLNKNYLPIKKPGAKQIWHYIDRNWIKVLFELLSSDGLIFIQLDEKLLFHLKLILDEIFGKDNFVNIFTIKTSDPSGFKTVNPSPYDAAEYILMYAKKKAEYSYETIYVPSEHDFGYNQYIKNINDNGNTKNTKKMSEVKEASDVYYEFITERLGYAFGWDEKKATPNEFPDAMTQDEAILILDQIDALVKVLPEFDGKVDFGDMDHPTEPLGWILLKAFYPKRYRRWSESFSASSDWEMEDMWEELHKNVTTPFYKRYGYKGFRE